MSWKACSPSTGTRARQALARPPPASVRCFDARRDRFTSDATTETHDIKCLRQLRASMTTRDGDTLRRVLVRSVVVYQILISLLAHAQQ